MSETIEDVVRDIRNRNICVPRDAESSHPLAEDMLHLADCIEAAVKREREAVGNAAKMREVVVETEKSIDKAISILEQIPETCGFDGILDDACDVLCYLKEEYVKPALSAPPRYCDIMSLDTARKVWFMKEIIPRLDGDLPLGMEKPFDEWFVSQHEEGEQK